MFRLDGGKAAVVRQIRTRSIAHEDDLNAGLGRQRRVRPDLRHGGANEPADRQIQRAQPDSAWGPGTPRFHRLHYAPFRAARVCLYPVSVLSSCRPPSPLRRYTMAGQKTQARSKHSARSRPPSARKREGQAPGRRLAAEAARWLWRFARPHSGLEGLTLFFAVLAILTPLVETASTTAHRNARVPNLILPVVLLVLSILSRTAPRWRGELETMTRDRARNYAGALLLGFVALSVCWHVVAGSLGLDAAFPVLGTFSALPAAGVVLGVLALLALGLILDAP